MPDLRVISSYLEVKGNITSNNVAVPTISSTSTLTNKTLTAPTITVPTMTLTTSGLTGTGATGSTAAVMPTAYPAFVTVTGASGSGVGLLTGPVNSAFFINNVTTGDLNVYCVGGTINGTTGTTAYVITATGNHCAWAYNTSASGAWRIAGNT